MYALFFAFFPVFPEFFILPLLFLNKMFLFEHRHAEFFVMTDFFVHQKMKAVFFIVIVWHLPDG